IKPAHLGLTKFAWSDGYSGIERVLRKSGRYELTGTNCSGISLTDSINVKFSTVPDVAFYNPYKLCVGDSLEIFIPFIDATYLWENGSDNPLRIFENGGVFSISAQNKCGIVQKDLIIEEDYCFDIPNVFTPNNDGINDRFLIEGKGILRYSGEIFNRWGKQIATFDHNLGWDGGGAVEAVYYYRVKIDFAGHYNISKSGFITLLR
ncbi:MAG: gliding motility-associated C-terminal domain-containing protein, partial [Bacteroidetes bacterium]|nr:gliding motility-associated C-terminal domain-containing protein [Bacteroidota bacterium]